MNRWICRVRPTDPLSIDPERGLLSATIILADDERTRLQRYIEWLLKVDDRAALRVLTRETAAGFYGVTPSGVMTFLALPVVRVDTDSAPVDTVMLGRTLLAEVKASREGVVVSNEVALSPALAALPPTDSWLPAERGLAGDVVTIIDRAVADRADADASTWGGFTLDSLRVAKGLGLFAHPSAQVVTATNAGWKRLMTPAGQVFVPPPRSGRGVLHLVKAR